MVPTETPADKPARRAMAVTIEEALSRVAEIITSARTREKIGQLVNQSVSIKMRVMVSMEPDGTYRIGMQSTTQGTRAVIANFANLRREARQP